MIAAILRAQWLSMRFGTRGRAVGVLVATIWYGLWVMGASVAWVSIAEADAAKLRLYLPVGMLGAFLYWQLMPVASASMGSALDLRKLLAYPIPHRKLFTVEVLLRLTTAIEMLIVLAGGVAGLAANPRVSAWGAVLSLPLFIGFNLLLSSGMRSLLERVLARRRVREVVVLLTTMLWVLPRLLMSMGYEGSALARLALAIQNVALPWTAAAHVAVGQSIAPGVLSLCGWVVVAGWFGRWQFERNLRYDATAAQATPDRALARPGIAERFFRLPGLLLRDPLAGIVEKELRSLARTPRFRMVFAMGFTFGLAVWFPLIATRNMDGPRAGSSWFLTVVCVYALTLLGQVSYWNCFGFDRSAAALYFAAPLSMTQVLAGKNIAALIYIYLEVLMVIAVTVALGLASGPGAAVETLIVMGICALYMLALGTLGSVRYPRGLSGERVAHGGGRGFQGFLFLIYPVALMPVGLAYLTRYAFENEVLFGVVLAIAAAIGGVFYWIALESAVKSAGRERERIIQELSQSDGPVVRD
jgi:ABC-2 type transport system permease protein